ncbi:hypothetical protein Plhal304r1_c029g0094681 [Plasmopara halstedii]
MRYVVGRVNQTSVEAQVPLSERLCQNDLGRRWQKSFSGSGNHKFDNSPNRYRCVALAGNKLISSAQKYTPMHDNSVEQILAPLCALNTIFHLPMTTELSGERPDS